MTSRSDAVPADSWRLGRLLGVDVLVKPSLLVMGAVLVLVFAPRFDDAGDGQPYLLALAFVVGLYASVLVHELAHVAVARRHGMRVHSVSLHLLGGETLIEGESRTPWQELATAAVGPVASLVIGVAGLVVADGLEPGTAHDVVWSIGMVNVLVAAFNMLPGLPLDGGRVLRAVVWWLTGREEAGIRFAAWLGRVAAVAVVVAVLLRDRDASRALLVVDLAVAGLVAWFLWTGAGDALRNAGRAARVNRLVARELVDVERPASDGALELPADLRGSTLLRAMAARPAAEYVLVEADGSRLGVLTAHAVDAAYRADRR